MDYRKALEILEIDISNVMFNDINICLLKKQYHKLALLNHPDKNGNTIESNEKFRDINCAYEYMLKEIQYSVETDNEINNDSNNNYQYLDILKLFMGGILDGKYNDIFVDIIKDIVVGCKNISIKLFEKLDIEMSLNVYSFLSQNKSIFHLNSETLEKVRDILLTKCKDIEIYNLNPTIDDLLENNIYKLYVDKQLFLVPLWHNELYFDYLDKNTNTTKELIVLCEPSLPDNLFIDENKNIHIEINVTFDDMKDLIVNNNNINCAVGRKVFEICTDKLYMTKTQQYKLVNSGLTRVNNDIYDISIKTDMIVTINLSG